ncbi:FkbM family methyltransferase [Candidatus Saccharibacteria bacterium]|nr:FkbM family methyltransferase [Candidatus Saccharibacteria bacterium]
MIDTKAITTFAQYNEDLILLALSHDKSEGFYVDVGANYPTIDSVTKLFYEKGWRGINIEPVKSLHQELLKERPKDINLMCGAGVKPGNLLLREYIGATGHSTFDEEVKKQRGDSSEYKEYEVPIKTLNDIFTENKVKQIDFLKVDVEGFEYEVILGNDWDKYRPEFICVEATHQSKDWKTHLKKNKYKLFISDGLNEYYVAEDSWDKATNGFEERIVMLDYRALKQHQQQSWSKDTEQLLLLTNIVKRHDKTIRDLSEALARSSRLSLTDQTWPRRLKRAIKGLTVDWYKFKTKK